MNVKILIADDNQQMRQVIRDMIQPFTSDVIECENGAEAVVLYWQEHPDCVLMDIEMRPMDGIAAATRIKESHPEARVVFVTQHDGPLLRKAAENCGADGYVLKEHLSDLNTLIPKLFSAKS